MSHRNRKQRRLAWQATIKMVQHKPKRDNAWLMFWRRLAAWWHETSTGHRLQRQGDMRGRTTGARCPACNRTFFWKH